MTRGVSSPYLKNLITGDKSEILLQNMADSPKSAIRYDETSTFQIKA